MDKLNIQLNEKVLLICIEENTACSMAAMGRHIRAVFLKV